jgi:hypothetical protein
MNFLIQIRHPCGCWKDFLVKRHCGVRMVMELIAEHYHADELHDVRIKRLRTTEELRRANRNVHHNWEKYGHKRRAKRGSRREH